MVKGFSKNEVGVSGDELWGGKNIYLFFRLR